jgi:hypothetical protein
MWDVKRTRDDGQESRNDSSLEQASIAASLLCNAAGTAVR